jgi:hypothetical protein
MPDFPYAEKWIIRTTGIGMQKIQHLFTLKKVVFGVLEVYAQ